jgi:hypothetical protein
MSCPVLRQLFPWSLANLLLGSFVFSIPVVAQYKETYVRAPSRDGVTTGSGEPTHVIVVPQATPFSGCSFGSQGMPMGSSEARAQLLDRNGPQLPPVFELSSFAVMGFSRGSWPVAIDYVLEQDSLLLVVISPEGATPLIYRLEGKKGHWVSKLQIPSTEGEELRVSQYLVQTLDDTMGRIAPSHIHIHGIAAGPKAVGSIGIDQVSFAPASIHLGAHEKAQFMYHSISDFDDTEVSFVRIAKVPTGEIVAAAVNRKTMGSIAQNHVKNGDWDGSIKTEDLAKNSSAPIKQWLVAPTGQHILQVRAWRSRDHGGDFVTALSESIVAVE